MPRTEKAQKITELTERIRGSQAMFVTDYRGLSVSDITELRRSLRDSGTRLTVAKNTLLRLAAGEAGVEGLRDLFEGPTAIAFVDGDPIGAAKGLADAVRRFRTLEIRGGLMEGRVLTSAEAQALATIEPREVLLSRIAGALKAETSRAAYMFQALQSRFLSVLEAYREKVPAAGGEAATTATPEAELEAPQEAAPQPGEGPAPHAAAGEVAGETGDAEGTDEPAEGDAGEEGKE